MGAVLALIVQQLTRLPARRSAGKKQEFDGHTYTVEELKPER